jgi:hypothetical protein
MYQGKHYWLTVERTKVSITDYQLTVERTKVNITDWQSNIPS